MQMTFINSPPVPQRVALLRLRFGTTGLPECAVRANRAAQQRR